MAQVHRFFCAGPFEVGGLVVLDEDTSRVVVSVLRLVEKDVVVLMDGVGSLAGASIVSVRKKEVHCRIDSIDVRRLPLAGLTLVQALLKSDKMEWVVQKGTELGISQFVFFEGQHSVSKINPKHRERLEKIALESIRQSGNPFLPKVEIFSSLKQFFSEVEHLPPHKLWMNEEEHSVYIKKHFESCEKKRGIAAVGPEGGWSNEEILLLKERDFCSIRLGSYILRSETAAVSVAACWNMFAVDGSYTHEVES